MNPFKMFKKPGQTFTYLGTKMTAIEITGGPYPSGDGGTSYMANQLKAEYVDDNGVIKTKMFGEEHLPVLVDTNHL